MQFSQIQKLCDLDADLGSEVIMVRISGPGLPTHQSENFLWTDGRTAGRTDTPEFQSIRSSPGHDLIKMVN